MSARFRIEGYVIVSADGMIADSHALMPDALKNDADRRVFESELDRADVLVHGRHSHEGQTNSTRRRRVILTRKIAAIAPNPDDPASVLWNPAGAAFEEACAALGLSSGGAAIIGGPEVYGLFLDVGYDAFHLTRIDSVKIPGGLLVFPQCRSGLSPEEALAQFALQPGTKRTLDEANGVSLVIWRRKATA